MHARLDRICEDEPSFCTMPYIATSWAIAVRTLRFERSLRRGSAARKRVAGRHGDIAPRIKRERTPSGCRLQAMGRRKGGEIGGVRQGAGQPEEKMRSVQRKSSADAESAG